MKKYIYLIIAALGVSCCSICLAGEQSFKINNSLSDMNISSEVEDYETKINHAIDDIDADGVIFIGGKKTKINSINSDGQAKFTLTDVEIKLKKSIIDKYQKKFSTMTSKLIWDQAMHNLLVNLGSRGESGCFDPLVFNSVSCRDQSLFSFNLVLKDKEENIIAERAIWANYEVPFTFFLEKGPLINKVENLSTMYVNNGSGYYDENGNLILFIGDISFDLPILQIKQIDHVAFLTVKNSRKN